MAVLGVLRRITSENSEGEAELIASKCRAHVVKKTIVKNEEK